MLQKDAKYLEMIAVNCSVEGSLPGNHHASSFGSYNVARGSKVNVAPFLDQESGHTTVSIGGSIEDGPVV